MAYRTGREHFVYFRVYNSGTPVTGLHLSDFTVIFLQDSTTCGLTLTVSEVSSGLYCASYTPTTPAFYYLELYNSTYTTRISDGVEIDSIDSFFGINNSIALSQNYGSTNRFKVTLSSPNSYTLYIYNSADWTAGNTGLQYVVNSTTIDTGGNWVTPILYVVHGTYTIIAKSISRTMVMAAYMAV